MGLLDRRAKGGSEGIVIKGGRNVNNLEHRAICLMLHTGIVMKYYTEGLAIERFG